MLVTRRIPGTEWVMPFIAGTGPEPGDSPITPDISGTHAVFVNCTMYHASMREQIVFGFFIWMSGRIAPMQVPKASMTKSTGLDGTTAIPMIREHTRASTTWCRVIISFLFLFYREPPFLYQDSTVRVKFGFSKSGGFVDRLTEYRAPGSRGFLRSDDVGHICPLPGAGGWCVVAVPGRIGPGYFIVVGRLCACPVGAFFPMDSTMMCGRHYNTFRLT